jgi:endonuclease-8
VPEGHTIHRLARNLQQVFAGERVSSSSPQGRFAAGAALVDGAVVDSAEAHGKHLFVGFPSALWVHVHLGLYGSFDVVTGPADPPRGQVRWRISGNRGHADLRGPTVCEVIGPAEKAAIQARLGADPLRGDDPTPALERIGRSRTSIGVALMDQSVLAGVGNVYRAEVLFRAGIDPARPGLEVDADTLRSIWSDLVALMSRGVANGRIDTVRPEHEPEAMGRPPRVDDHGGEVYVYRRHGRPCHVCGQPVRTAVVAGRNLFWCPSCQR